MDATTERRDGITDGDSIPSTPPPLSCDTPRTEESSLNLPNSQDIPLLFSNKSLHPEASKPNPSKSVVEKTSDQLPEFVSTSSASVNASVNMDKNLLEEIEEEKAFSTTDAEATENLRNSDVQFPSEFPSEADNNDPACFSTPNIVNLHDVGSIEEWVKEGNGNHVYIGRGSEEDIWGNPHKLAEHENDRNQVLDLFRSYIQKEDDLMKRVGDLHGKTLGCWCAPDRCHGEILHELAGNRPIYEGALMDNVIDQKILPANDSPGTKFINALSAVIVDDITLEDSTVLSPASAAVPNKSIITPTTDTMAIYSSIAEHSGLSPISNLYSPSQCFAIEESKNVEKSRSGSDPLPKVHTIRTELDPQRDQIVSTDVDNSDGEPSTFNGLEKERLSKSMPNLSINSQDQDFIVDPLALSKVLWCINSKLEGFEKKFVSVHNKIEYVEAYLKSLVTNQLTNFEKSLDGSAKECERSRKNNFDILCDKIDDCVRDNEVIRRQWTEHMDRLKENLLIMEDDEDESEAEVEDDGRQTDRRRPLENERVNVNAEKKIQDLEEKLNEKIFNLDCRIVECEQYSCRECLVITGIPESIEDVTELESTIITTLEKLGIHIKVTDISACHRLGPYRNNSNFPRSVIVRFINRNIVYLALNNRGKLWGLREVLNMHLRFYESLCSLNNESRKLCNKLQQRGVIQSFSIWHGFVKIVVNEGDRPFRIRHPDVLREMFDVS